MIKLSNFFCHILMQKKIYTLKEWMYSIVYLCHLELLRVKELVGTVMAFKMKGC